MYKKVLTMCFHRTLRPHIAPWVQAHPVRATLMFAYIMVGSITVSRYVRAMVDEWANRVDTPTQPPAHRVPAPHLYSTN